MIREIEGLGYALQGLSLNGDDGEGVDWKAFDIEDWDSPPATTGGTFQKELAHGGWITPAFDESHSMRLIGRLQSDDRPAGSRGLKQFVDCLPRYEVGVLARSMDGEVWHRKVRVYGVPKITRPTDKYTTYDVVLSAPDPRKFGGDGATPYQYQEQAFLPSSSGGLQMPFTVPFAIDANVVNGSVVVETLGDAPPLVLIRINGPAVQPVIRDGEGGVMPLDISLSAGQWLDVDLDAHTIKINGTVNRRNLLRGAWITPRTGMVLSLDAAVQDPLTSMTVFWTDASY